MTWTNQVSPPIAAAFNKPSRLNSTPKRATRHLFLARNT
jgi:hypothetical protein